MGRRRQVMVQRCPACGQQFQPPAPTTCTLCGYNLDFGREPATGEDATPYARAFAHEQPGWRRMAEWIWFAQWGRLKHLAMMRASAASVRFALINATLLALGLGLVQSTRVGWRAVAVSADLEAAGAVTPGGAGWLRLVTAPQPSAADLVRDSSAVAVHLWWSPPQMVIGFAVGTIAAMVLMWIGLVLTRALATAAHTDPYREEQRMQAAIHYSTAWAVPLVVAALVVGLRPFAYVGRVAGWGWYPKLSVIIVVAGVIAFFGVAMWWFWLGRLGTTAPAATRGRVTACLSVAVPLVAALLAAAWWFGVSLACRIIFDRTGLAF